MSDRQSDAKWILRQGADAFSWTGIGWFVALFLGLWGAMIGIGAFIAAYVSLGICMMLCVLKWGHTTNIHARYRRTGAFVFGMLLIAGLSAIMLSWTHGRRLHANEDAKKLEPLKDIPNLRRQLEELPRMQQTIVALQNENKSAIDASAKKQEIIEGLAQTVIAQQKVASEKAHEDLQHTELALSTNINQYRNDTTSAVGKIMRPPRTLAEKRSALVALLKSFGPHDIAITPAHGSAEALSYSDELQSAFQEAGWHIVRTQKFVFMIRDAVGLGLATKQFPDNNPTVAWKDLTPGQAAVGQAFLNSGIGIVAQAVDKGDTGPTELYVGLQ